MRPALRPLAAAVLLGGACFAAGYLAGGAGGGGAPDGAPGAFVQRRSGGVKLINPLLECDIADDVLANRALVPFRDRVLRRIEALERSGHVAGASVYFRELNDGLWFSIGQTRKYFPASLNKLPLAIAVLHMADQPGWAGLLERRLRHDLGRDYNEVQSFTPSRRLEPGVEYTVGELLFRMIAYSDNNAYHLLLMKVVDRAELARVYGVLRMQSPRVPEDDEYLSVQTFASFFRVLYNATYLSQDASEWLLEALAQAEYRRGLVAGVPDGVTVAHKFGEAADDGAGAVQLHDCGIVYAPRHPYLLCVMTRGRDFERLHEVIAAVSAEVYAAVTEPHPPAPAPAPPAVRAP